MNGAVLGGGVVRGSVTSRSIQKYRFYSAGTAITERAIRRQHIQQASVRKGYCDGRVFPHSPEQRPSPHDTLAILPANFRVRELFQTAIRRFAVLLLSH